MDELPTFAVDFPAAKQLADLASVFQDLTFVDGALDRLWLLQNEGSEDQIQIHSLWTAALIAYYRCFAAGKRFGLTDDVFQTLKGGTEFHQHYKKMRDKHIAHSVNPFEQVRVGVALSNDRERSEAPASVLPTSWVIVIYASEDEL